MSLRYLLDTNTLSEPLRKQPNTTVVSKIQKHQQEIAISAQVLYEITKGAHRLPESHKRTCILEYIQEFIRPKLPILPYDDNAASWQGIEAARLIKQGLTPSPIDSQIAAVAQTNGLILVTRNIADFKNFQGLQIENWFE